MGDEGVGCALAERLAGDKRLPPEIEVIEAGTDLLDCAGQMAGRTSVTLLDAMLDPLEPGVLRVFKGDLSEFEHGQPSVHQLSVPGSLELLKAAYPQLRDIRFTLLAVTVDSAEARARLSPALEAMLPDLVERILEELRGGVTRR